MTTTPEAHSICPDPAAIALTIRKHDVRVDSRQIAAHLGIKHKSAFESITKHRAIFETLGILPFETAKSHADHAGRPERFALLNEDQAHFLLTLSRNTPRVVALKAKLVQTFSATRTALAAYRDGTLPSTKALQDAIQAVPGGPGPWLYSNIAKLVNTTAGMAAGTRAAGDTIKQASLTLMQTVATQAVSHATDAKDAYYRVKEALQPFGAIAIAGTAAA